jgi:alcohol dehydrogenase (NADP+)
MLDVHGKFVTCGLPDTPFPGLAGMALSSNGAFFGGSHLGNRAEVLAMLKLAAEKGIRPWVEVMPMKDVARAVEGVRANKVRYRYILVADIEGPSGVDAAEAAAKNKPLLQSVKETIGL